MAASWLGSPVIKRDFGTNGGSWTRQPALIVLHSTEGTGTTDYQDGAVAPHFTLDPNTGTIWQHISLQKAARALKNTSGGAETNRAGAIQIEIIGTCDPNHRGDAGWTYLPDMTSDMASRVRKLLDMIHDAIPAIPLTTSVKFEPYPDPGYGSGHPRLSASQWNSYKGVLGHQHVVENDHGDPGDIPISMILGSGEDDMPTYVHLAVKKAIALPAATWTYVTWDTIGGGAGSPSDAVANPGSPSIDIGGHPYAATLTLAASIPDGAFLESRSVEGDLSGEGGAFKILDSTPVIVVRPAVENNYWQDNRSAKVAGGRKLRWQVYASEAGQLTAADLALLYW